MAKFRLKAAHQLRHSGVDSDVWLPGDTENEHLGDEKGTLVGDGTPYPVKSATIEMVALDDEAEAMIRDERDRLARNHTSMNPVEHLPTVLQALVQRDDYDDRYVPGFPGVPRPAAPSVVASNPTPPRRGA
jgi:hypothetical protein